MLKQCIPVKLTCSKHARIYGIYCIFYYIIAYALYFRNNIFVTCTLIPNYISANL